MGLLNNKRSQYIVRVDRDDDAALTKEIHLASPPSNGRIAILRQFLEEEAIEAIAEHHNIPLDEFNGLTAEEAREQIKQELQIPAVIRGIHR